jgi:anti-sigma factor ChrR (cupin superfamily)
VPHPDEERLENYSVGVLSDLQAGLVEVHLLLCGFCRERLVGIDDYVLAMSGACAEWVRTHGA